MGGLLLFAAIVFIFLPIVSIVKISGLDSKLDRLEKTVGELKELVSATAAPPGAADETTAPEPKEPEELYAPKILETPEIPEPQEDIYAPAEAVAEIISAPEPRNPEEIQPLYAEGAALPEADSAQIEPRSEAAAKEPAPQPLWQSWHTPSKPSWLEKNLKLASSWLLKEGNIWVSIGVLLFLAGFGLLFSYVSQMGLVSIEMRLAGSAAIGIAMAAFGWRMREKRRTYALILQGGGIGILYIVLLAGAKLGPVLPISAAVIGMLLLCAFTILLALLQNFELLALFALLGGFAAPILVSTGSDNFVALFSIYSLLNFEILFITARRDWKKIRWGGLLASALVGAVWGFLRWRAELFASVEPFIIILFVTYNAITLIPFLSGAQGINKWIANRGRADVPMTLTLPFIFLFMQIPAASHTKYGVALSCLALGAWYLAAGRFAMKHKSLAAAEAGFTPRIFLIYCILFSNLAVPFIFKQAVSSAVWAIEGAILIAHAAREKKAGGTFFCGIILHAAALVLYNFGPYLHLPAHLYEIASAQSGLLDWKNETSPFLLTGMLFALSALASSYFAKRLDDSGETGPYELRIGKIAKFRLPDTSTLVWAFAIYGTAWWKLSVFHVVFVSMKGSASIVLSIFSLGALAGYLLSTRLKWDAVRFLSVPAISSVLFFGFTGKLLWNRLAFVFLSLMFMRQNQMAEYGSMFIGDHWHLQLLSWASFAAMFAAAVITYGRDRRDGLRRITWGILLFAFLSYTEYVWSGLPRLLPGTAEHYELGLFLGFLPVAALIAVFTLRRFTNSAKFDRLTKITQMNPLAQLAQIAKMDFYERESLIAISLVLLAGLPRFIASLGSTKTGIASFYIPLLNPLELWQVLYISCSGLALGALREEWTPAAGKAKRIGLRCVLPFIGFVLLNSIAARAAMLYFGERVRWGYMLHAPHFQGLIAMLWGVTALALIFGGKRYAVRFPWFLGAGLLAADIVKLMLIDLRNSATVIRILAFLLLGGLFLLIGWIAPLPPKADANEGEEEGANGDEDEQE